MTIKVTANIGNENYLTEIKSNTNAIISDEPLSNGGQDKGFNPFELLASALASCTCATLKMYADRKQWKFEKIHVVVTFEKNNNISKFERKISFIGNPNQEQQKRFLAIAIACPVYKILTNKIEINTTLEN